MFNFIQLYNFQRDTSEKSWTDTDTSKNNHCLVSWIANENGACQCPKDTLCVICFLIKAQLKPFHILLIQVYIFVNFKILTDQSLSPSFFLKHEERWQLRHLLFTIAILSRALYQSKNYLLSIWSVFIIPVVQEV